MNIGGFMQTTLLDYPGKVAATIFTTACNMKCPFCHNGDLVFGDVSPYEENDVLSYLSKRRKVLDGVCITGGEPTLQKDLAEFIFKIKEIGLLVKLDSNGLRPDILKSLYEGHLIDMVAMDIKASKDNYLTASGLDAINMDLIYESIDFLINSGIEYEFRTTLVKGIHNRDNINGICEMINGAKHYYLQSFKENEKAIYKIKNYKNTYGSFNENELSEFLSIAKSYIPAAELRGI